MRRTAAWLAAVAALALGAGAAPPLWAEPAAARDDARAMERCRELLDRAKAAHGRRDEALAALREGLRLQASAPDPRARRSFLTDLAFAFDALEARADALEAAGQALRLAREDGAPVSLAESLRTHAFFLGKARQPQAAIAALEESLPLRRAAGDWRMELLVLTDIAAQHRAAGALGKGLPHLRAAVRVARAHGYGATRKERDEVLRTLAGFGATCVDLHETREALQVYTLMERLAWDSGDLRFVEQAVRGRGGIYQGNGEFRRALAATLATVPLLRALGDWKRELIVAREIASLYQTLLEPANAIPYLEDALALARSHAAEDPRMLGETLCKTGRVYQSMRAPDRAIACLREALEVGTASGDRSLQSEALQTIGAFHRDRGEYPQALEANGRAIALSQARGDRFLEAWQRGLQACLLVRAGQPAQARDALEQAVRLAREEGAARREGEILAEFGFACHFAGDDAGARIWCEKALPLRLASGDRSGAAYTLRMLGEICDPVAGRRWFAQAAALYAALGDRGEEADVLTVWADRERSRGMFADAERVYLRAIALDERLRREAGGMSAQGAFFEGMRDAYAGYLTVLVRRGRAAEAFALVQRTKARGLLDLMAGGRVDLGGRRTRDEQAEERRRVARCEALAAAMVREAARNVPGSKKRYAAARAALAAAERELAVYRDALVARHPERAGRRAAVPASLAAVARALPRGAALLEFATLAEGRTVLLVATRDGRVTAHPIVATAEALAGSVAALRRACATPRGRWEAPARRLHRALIAPASARLAGITHLVVCPDRTLWDVPFAVLTDARGTPLLERHALSFASSATAWHAARLARRRSSAAPRMLVLANPRFDAEKRFENGPEVAGQRPLTVPERPLTVPERPLTVPERPLTVPERPLTVPEREVSLPRGTRLVDLPGTQREADALARRFPGAAVYTRERAQESVVKRSASRFQRLHIASHAFVNDASPLLSSIVLANPTPQSGDDGFLTAREILDLDLSGVELTVLSACNTARGASRGGEGIVGLTWALSAAGCPTQVLSQWSVDDASAAVLMERFYGALADGWSKGDALRRAARAVRRDPRRAHPYHWAPFVLLGDPR